jgi:thiamine-phosphate diphosphorylase
LPQEQVTDQIAKSVALCSVHGIRLFVNDYWREAIAAGAYGVHLGQEDLDTADINEIKKAGLRLGISTHSVFELARALSLKPSYVALGPIFETTCKSMSFGPQGFDRINEWMALSDCPVVAIGGLTLDHTAKLRNIGADGVAVLSNITGSDAPELQVKTWIKELGYTKRVL